MRIVETNFANLVARLWSRFGSAAYCNGKGDSVRIPGMPPGASDFVSLSPASHFPKTPNNCFPPRARVGNGCATMNLTSTFVHATQPLSHSSSWYAPQPAGSHRPTATRENGGEEILCGCQCERFSFPHKAGSLTSIYRTKKTASAIEPFHVFWLTYVENYDLLRDVVHFCWLDDSMHKRLLFGLFAVT
jgi:hypothetical protein